MNYSKTGSGRRRWTSKQRQRLLARFHQSQLTQRDFAGRHGVGLSTLSKWLRVESEATSAPVKFQEVTLPSAEVCWVAEIVSPQGWIVRLQKGCSLQALPELLGALPC